MTARLKSYTLNLVMVARRSLKTSIIEKSLGKTQRSFRELPVSGVFIVIFVIVHTSLTAFFVNSFTRRKPNDTQYTCQYLLHLSCVLWEVCDAGGGAHHDVVVNAARRHTSVLVPLKAVSNVQVYTDGGL